MLLTSQRILQYDMLRALKAITWQRNGLWIRQKWTLRREKVYHKKFHFGSVQAKEIKKGRCIQLNDWGLGLLSFAIFVLQTWLHQQV